MRPFRFQGGVGPFTSRQELVDGLKRLEAHGYSITGTGDHISFGGLASIPYLAALAHANTTLRLSSIFAIDLRNPVQLAHEVASVDVLSGGRLEFGMGAGWFRGDYAALGISYDAPGVRLNRLAEAVGLVKRLFREETVSHDGTYFKVQNLNLQPKPVQQPYPPIFIGGGRQRILELAAREADIVGIDPASLPNGTLDMMSASAEAVAQKVAWVRAAAGERLPDLEFHLNILNTVITDSKQQGIDRVRAEHQAYSALTSNQNLTDEQIFESPHALIGSVDTLVEKLHMLREVYGISYFSMFDSAASAPLVARLAGQ